MANEILLQVKDLKMHFPTGTKGIFNNEKTFVYAVDGVSFDIKRGETLGLVGESGCGKSTVARAVAQLYKPTSGEVLLAGTDLTKMNRRELFAARKDMQIVFQDPYSSLDPRMTTMQIISEPMLIYRRKGLVNMTDAEIEKHVEHLID